MITRVIIERLWDETTLYVAWSDKTLMRKESQSSKTANTKADNWELAVRLDRYVICLHVTAGTRIVPNSSVQHSVPNGWIG